MPSKFTPIDPKDVRDLEAEYPNIIRFLRSISDGGTKELEVFSSYVREYIKVERIIENALMDKVDKRIVAMVTSQVSDPTFRREVLALDSDTDGVFTFIKSWFSKQGIVFLGADTDEV